MIVECISCESHVEGKTISSYSYDTGQSPPGIYTFLRCPKCSDPILVVQERFGDELDDPFRIYPAQEDRISHSIPEPIRNAYGEAWRCYKSKAHTAAAIMCRKTLEAICAEHEAKGKTLVASLKDLKDKGVIENRLFEWADALRISGNEAAHDVNVTVSREDARDLMEFTKALLEYVFTFRDKFEEFKKRREKPRPA